MLLKRQSSIVYESIQLIAIPTTPNLRLFHLGFVLALLEEEYKEDGHMDSSQLVVAVPAWDQAEEILVNLHKLKEVTYSKLLNNPDNLPLESYLFYYCLCLFRKHSWP